jgi:hypothetical protein
LNKRIVVKNLPSIPGTPGAPEKKRIEKVYSNNVFFIFLTLITSLSTSTWFSSFTVNQTSKIISNSILYTYPFKPSGPGSPFTPGKPESPIN